MKKYKLIIAFALLFILILTVIFFINIYKETTFYSNLSRLFLTIGILSIVLNSSYIRYKEKFTSENFNKKPYLTFILIVLTAILSAFMLIKIMKSGFYNGVQLYYQISSILFALIGIGLLISLHVKLVNNK